MFDSQRRLSTRLAAMTLAATLVVTGAPIATAKTSIDAAELPGLSSKAPYPVPDEVVDDAPPAGYRAVLTQGVARHGSRGLSRAKYDSLTQQVWEAAKAEHALTRLGKKLGHSVRELIKANEKRGYGNLTARGTNEHQQLGVRAEERMPGVFDALAGANGSVELSSSGQQRATDSGINFGKGLVESEPDLAGKIGEVAADPETLYFHKTDPEYLDYADNDPRLAAVLDELDGLPQTESVARQMMERLYTPEFVDRLAAGEFHFVDPSKGDTFVDDEVDAASMLYECYIISAGMSEELKTDWSQFVTAEDAEWFGYLNDAEYFYEKGPGFAGEDATYRMAEVLRDAFLAEVDAHSVPNAEPGAVFRFSHGEEILPFAALLRLPGSEQQQPEGALYTHENNPFRGAQVVPMSSNIQWDTFVADDGAALTRVLYNEREVTLPEPCDAAPDAPFFYTTEELHACLPQIAYPAP